MQPVREWFLHDVRQQAETSAWMPSASVNAKALVQSPADRLRKPEYPQLLAWWFFFWFLMMVHLVVQGVT